MKEERTRTEIADLILARLSAERAVLSADYGRHAIPHFVADDLLPRELAMAIHRAFPPIERMKLRDSLRRAAVRRIARQGLIETKHYYRREA